MKSPQTTYGIIGYPVEQSLSPVLHNTAFEELGVNAIYKLFPLQEGQLKDFFAELREKKSPIFGLNVTVPYKEKVIPYLDSLSLFAERVGAVNTIAIDEDRRLVGYNTDGPGFLAHLTELNVQFKNKRVAILGAGGTARAIIAMLCLLPEQPQAVCVYNRTPEKLKHLINDLGSRLNVQVLKEAKAIDDLNLESADILINTTSLGLKKDDPCLVSEELLHSHMFVYDVVYNPLVTPLLKLAKEKGALVSNGLGFLFYQGVLAFQHWAQAQLADKVKIKMRRALEKAAEK